MIWVGGGIIVHGLEEYGLPAIGHAIHHAAEVVGHALAPIGGAAEWTVSAAGSGGVGVVVGAALIPITGLVLAPIWKWASGLRTDKQPWLNR
jgi:predicted DNA repair protein MutK